MADVLWRKVGLPAFSADAEIDEDKPVETFTGGMGKIVNMGERRKMSIQGGMG